MSRATTASLSNTWHEVAKSHPAARTTVIHKSAHPDPESAVSATFNSSVTLTKLSSKLHGDFVEKNGWTAWRVGAPDALDGLNGSWVYTRPTEGGYLPWQPTTWQDCVQRYEQCTHTKVSPRANWKKHLKRDQAVVDSMLAAIGTDDPMNPFNEFHTSQLASAICEQIIKPSLLITRQVSSTQTNATRVKPTRTHMMQATQAKATQTKSEGSKGKHQKHSNTHTATHTARRWERMLSSIYTESDLKAATKHLAESIVSEHAEDWLYQKAEDWLYQKAEDWIQQHDADNQDNRHADNQLDVLEQMDVLERILIKTLEESRFLMLASYCAIARMCADDPTHAKLWYTTGGDCSGHRNIAAYASSSQKHI